MPDPIALRAEAPASLELPPAHLELSWRSLTREDAEGLFVLIGAIEAADDVPARQSRDEVVEMLEGEWKDLATDSLAGVDDSGAIQAYAMVEVLPGDTTTLRAFLRGGVHPQWRGRGIGPELLRWQEGRGRQLLAESGKDLPARLAVYVDEPARDQRRLLAAAGFSPIRWYRTMRRDLSHPLPVVPDLPAGVRLEPWTAERDEAIRLAHNDAFADHWGSQPQTAETWRHGPHFVPGWSLVALADVPADDGGPAREEVVGYLVSGRYEQDWSVVGYTFGYVDLLGVRAHWRKKGVAVALLATAMAAYAADGMEYAVLGVDTDNPTGAHGLYERVGFTPTHAEVLDRVEI